MNFDKWILEAIKGYTSEKPQDLAGIIDNIDGREKLIIGHDELQEALIPIKYLGREKFSLLKS